MIERKDELIANLSTRLAEVVMQHEGEEEEAVDEEEKDRGVEKEEEKGAESIYPLQLAAPAFSHFSSSAQYYSSGLPTLICKRDRSGTYSAPIEAPPDAARNGRPSHRGKRACYHPGRHQEDDGSSSSSSSTDTSTALPTLAHELEKLLVEAVARCLM